jgi:hypothetical protein
MFKGERAVLALDQRLHGAAHQEEALVALPASGLGSSSAQRATNSVSLTLSTAAYSLSITSSTWRSLAP